MLKTLTKFFSILFLLFSTVFLAQNTVKDSVFIYEKDTISVFEPKFFEPNFKEKYQGNAFEYEPKVEVNSTLEQFKNWLRNVLYNIFGLGSENGKLVDLLIKIGATILVIFVVYFIVKAILNKESQWIFGKSSKNFITDENIETNLHEANFEQLIQEKLIQKDYRLAIRFYYLFLLKKMSDAKIIDWEINKTNADYAYEIKNESQKSQFEKLSYLYEYIWYGEFDVAENQYLQAIQQFKESIKTFKNE